MPLIDLNGLLSLGCEAEVTVGIGGQRALESETLELLSISECSLGLRSFQRAEDLVGALREGEIGAAVRGTLNSSEVLKTIKSAFEIREIMRTAVLEDAEGRQFLLCPVGIDEGMDLRARAQLVEATSSYFSRAGWRLRVGVLSKGRPEDSSRGEHVKASLADGERLVEELATKGFDAKHYGILVEDAVKECNLIVAPDGISGNLIFRTLHFLGGCRAFGAPIVNLNRVFVDTSRAKADFAEPVKLAAGLAELQRRAGEA